MVDDECVERWMGGGMDGWMIGWMGRYREKEIERDKEITR